MTDDKLITAGMLADRLRPIVLGGDAACLDGTPMIPLHRGTVSAIYQHLERLADLDGEKTLGALECALIRADERHAEEKARIASSIEARQGRDTEEWPDAKRESLTAEGGDAQ